MSLLWLAFWELSADMGIFILFGLLAAGVLHQFVREQWIRKHLEPNTLSAVSKASLVGAPLPLCSCSVIPFAASLRRSGASKGSTLSFLISTPITGVDSILATFGMFGWIFTFYRLVSSLIMAVAAGILMNRFEKEEPKPLPRFGLSPAAQSPGIVLPKAAELPPSFSIRKVFDYGFGTLLGSFAKPLFWGLVIGAAITVAVPGNLQELFGSTRYLGYLVAIAIAVPMYVCATASLPIAASLIMAGISPGAAFIFLSAGPATNTVTIGVVKSMLGMRALTIYLAVIVVGSLLFGIAIDAIFDTMEINLRGHVLEQHSLVDEIGAGILLLLLGWHLSKGWFRRDKSCGSGSCCS
jgi:hypothetical protein